MTYREAIDFLYSQLPMYQRVGKAAYKANLDNTHRLDAHFGHPHRRYPTIHVAGTNGKGSVSHMLASVLQEGGYRTGLYTSPHLLDFRERIRVNGNPIPEEMVTGFIGNNHQLIKDVSPSFFEMTVAMAFDYFAKEEVRVAIIETGLGGRLDSTNIIHPVASVITNISMDHMEFLGDDEASIAAEKGGIIKTGVPVVLGNMTPEATEVLTRMALEHDATVCKAGDLYEKLFHTLTPEGASLFRIRENEGGRVMEFPCDLAGNYQHENLVTALAVIRELGRLGWELPPVAVKTGLASVTGNTGLLGRWQTVGTNPRSICDTAHNRAGIRAVMEQVMQIPWKELHMVWGMVSDKQVASILPLLPRKATYYFTRASIPRSMDEIALRNSAREVGLQGEAFSSVGKAYSAALANATGEDMIFTGGSTFVVADLLHSLGY